MDHAHPSRKRASLTAWSKDTSNVTTRCTAITSHRRARPSFRAEPQTDPIRHFPEPQTGPNPALPQTAAAVVHAAAPAPSLVVSTLPSFVVDLAHILSTAMYDMAPAPPLSTSPHLQPRLAKQGSLPSSTLPPLRQALLDRLVSRPWSPVPHPRLAAIPCSLARLSIWHSGTCLQHRGSRMLGHTWSCDDGGYSVS